MAIQGRNKIKEYRDNLSYKKYIEDTLKSDRKKFCPFRLERQMETLFKVISPNLKQKNQRILEVGCGYGRLIHFLNEYFPNQEYWGIDYIPKLISQAKANFNDRSNVHFEVLNAMNLSKKYHRHFDITILYKTLSWLPYYERMIVEMAKATRKKIFLTSLFYDGDIDFLTQVIPQAGSTGNQGIFMNTYSLPKFTKFCKKVGINKVSSRDLHIDIDLKLSKDPNILQTHTLKAAKGPRLEVTGVVLLNWKLIELTVA